MPTMRVGIVGIKYATPRWLGLPVIFSKKKEFLLYCAQLLRFIPRVEDVQVRNMVDWMQRELDVIAYVRGL
jgi:hypothetical protein